MALDLIYWKAPREHPSLAPPIEAHQREIEEQKNHDLEGGIPRDFVRRELDHSVIPTTHWKSKIAFGEQPVDGRHDMQINPRLIPKKQQQDVVF